MNSQFGALERVFSMTGRTLLGVLVLCGLTEFGYPQGNQAAPVYDVTPRRLVQIPPGTVIEQEAPRGWSYLIVKSKPRIGAGDVAQVTDQVKQMASFLFTAVVARSHVEKVAGQTRYRLGDVGVGMGTTVNGKDMIITPETQQKLGANLAFVARIVLSETQKRAEQSLVVARSETMALIDAPAILQRDGKHRLIVIRYALLLDPRTGRLDILVWPIDRDARGSYAGVSGLCEWLPPNKQEDCVLHVDAREFNFAGVPSEMAFAMNTFIQGQRQIAIPEDQKGLAGRARLSRAMAAELEVKLRALLSRVAR